MNTKITPQHLSKPAYIYIRQSTMAQVRAPSGKPPSASTR